MPELQIKSSCSPWISARNAVWEKALHQGIKRVYKKGSIIIAAGGAVEYLYYLRAGRLKLSRVSSDGTEKILWYLERGNLFGESPFFRQKPIQTNFTAVENCEVYVFTRQCIYRDILINHPDLTISMLESLAHKARVMALQGSDLTSLTSRLSKVLIYVLEREHIGKTAGKVECARGISQQELASILGVHRVTLNYAVAQLKREGIIEEISKSRLAIKDLERLLQIATA